MLPLLATPNPFCTPSAAFFGFMGVAVCLTLCNMGSAYGTAKAGVSLAFLGIVEPKKTMRGLITGIFAGVMSIYGVVMAALLTSVVTLDGTYSNMSGYTHFSAGLTVGMTCLAAGMSIGVIADVGLRAYGKVTATFIPMILLLIFAEVLSIYGIIIGIMMIYSNKGPLCGPIKPRVA